MPASIPGIPSLVPLPSEHLKEICHLARLYQRLFRAIASLLRVVDNLGSIPRRVITLDVWTTLFCSRPCRFIFFGLFCWRDALAFMLPSNLISPFTGALMSRASGADTRYHTPHWAAHHLEVFIHKRNRFFSPHAYRQLA